MDKTDLFFYFVKIWRTKLHIKISRERRNEEETPFAKMAESLVFLIQNDFLSTKKEKSIRKYKNFLKENELEYCDDLRHFENRENKLTHENRLAIERDTFKFTKKVSDEIKQLKNHTDCVRAHSQKQHFQLIIFHLIDRLKQINDLMSEMQKKREKNFLNKKWGLESFKNIFGKIENFENGEKIGVFGRFENERKVEKMAKFGKEKSVELAEINQSRTKMANISKMLNMFASEIENQRNKIDTLNNSAEGSLWNYESANKSMRSTFLRRSGSNKFHKMIIFILAGICLLFLDWFSP
ncbi:hypothetical protein MHBO_000582 [Bonamia ostreae]|uniref:t-SNARE coiled-coil homology domain-containing protein n=1 Tax=Bonamia ostreae TaxID=126728 RepID=A0ABV2AG62_9EUKA